MPRGQPFQVRDDDPTMQQIAATVKARGVRQPGLVRPDPEGGYEIIAGHRRYRASELAGLEDMPVIIRNMTDEEAATELVDSNIQREDVLPSERAWAYRLRLEVAKHIFYDNHIDISGFNICQHFLEPRAIKSRTADSVVYIEFVPSNAMFFGVTL